MEISLQRANLALGNTEGLLHQFSEPHLAYVKNSANKKHSNTQTDSGLVSKSQGHFPWQGQGDSYEMPVDIRSEIAAMETQLHRLEFETERKRNCYRSELDNMASHIPDAICIQPV